MTPRRHLVRLAIYIVGGLLFLWFAQRATGQIGSWRDMPPARYHGTATALVVYAERDTIERICGGRPIIGCYANGAVYMPEQCGTGHRVETVNVASLIRNDFSFCGSVKAHEFGHVNGWPGHHPR
jgi:hypothetical protein